MILFYFLQKFTRFSSLSFKLQHSMLHYLAVNWIKPSMHLAEEKLTSRIELPLTGIQL